MLIGHETLREELTKLVGAGRLAHGYIFFGPPRVGKATVGRALAHFLEAHIFDWSEDHAPPLGDLLTISPEAEKRSIGIHQVREIRNFLSQTPNRSSRRTVVIDGGEFLTDDAENALLKITEEPHSRALIIVAVDDPERLLPTVRSRMQLMHFGVVARPDIERWLIATGSEKSVAADSALRCGGAPGLAWRMVHDEHFARMLSWTGEFVKRSDRARADFIKTLVDEETFHLDEFLEALAIHYFSEPASARKQPHLWHALMELRRNENFFNLNARLQITALARRFDAAR